MLKKKNIAMVMAATTFVATATPAFATFKKENVDEATLVKKVEELLNVKYSDPSESGKGVVVTSGNEYLNSVYEITVGAPNGTVITSVSDLKSRIETAKIDNSTLTIYVTDKGHKEVDGKIVGSEVNKYSKYTDGTALHTQLDSTSATNITAIEATVEYFDAAGVKTTTAAQVDKAVITLANENKVEVSVDDYQLNFAEPVDVNGNIISIDNITTANAKKIVGFNLVEGAESRQDLPKKEVSKFVFGENNLTINEELSTFVTETGYTKKGVELVNNMIDATSSNIEVVKNGKTYNIAQITVNANEDAEATDNMSSVKPSEEGGYEFSIRLTVNEVDKTEMTNVKLVITSEYQKDLLALREAIVAGDDVVEGNGTSATIEGDDRFETAVKISKEAYDGKAGAVVLVGENAIVDGLAASPLAVQKDAPILLAKKDVVDSTTMAEIERVLPTNGTIYVVGGENTISKEVEKQLINKLNANIVRISGDDRYDTSLEIAKKLTLGTTTVDTKAFVVGGDGLADAMSIAAVASNALYTDTSNATPIIVTPESGLTVEAKHFIDKNTSITAVDVVGGTSKVSSKVLSDLNDIDNVATVTRVAGDDRQETNAKVIDRYYLTAGQTDAKKIKLDNKYDDSSADTKAATINDIFVAQDGYVGGDSKLIDALAAAPLAGSKNAPIVLATDNLSLKQEQVIDTKTDKHTGTANTNTYNKLTKIGGGVSASPIQKLLKVLGL